MPTTDLITLLAQRAATVVFKQSYGQETSGQAGGQIRVLTRRAPLWTIKVDCPIVWLEEEQQVKALIGSMSQSVGSFYAWNPERPFPFADADGSIVGASTVQIKSLGGDGISLALKGLPDGYVLTRGDYIGFTYSSTKKALHQVVAASVTADGSGDTAEFEVHPAIRQGAAVDDAVDLKEPVAEFRIVPGSYEPGTEGPHGRLSLEAVQVV